MTDVFRARPKGADRSEAPYAIKVLKPAWQGEAAAEALLRREFEASAAVRHRSLMTVLYVERNEATCWTVMPWLEGFTLADLLCGDALPHSAALWYARQVAEALDAMYQAGWMHGDVKPANVIVSPEGHATLIDLGFARRTEDQRGLHRHGWGTPQYIAPEAITSSLLPDIRSDLYSLGVMLYEALSGRRPFDASDVSALVRQHRYTRPCPLQLAVPALPKPITDLVDRLLAKEPLRRPQTPSEVISILARAEISTLAERSRLRLSQREATPVVVSIGV
jgi:serine/threonine-protein kinase